MTELVDAPAASPPAPPPAEAPVTAPRFLDDVYQAASECNKCSLCQAVCPTYVVNPVEWETARGRVALIRDAMEGRLELRDIADGPLSTCLTCNNCVAACAPRVPTGEIVSRARQELYDQDGHPVGQTLVFGSVLSKSGSLRLLRGLSRATQVTGLHWLARATGLTRWLGTPGAMMELVGPLPRRDAYRRARRVPGPEGSPRGRLGFLVCCYQNLAAPEATEATMRVLAANGWELVVPRLACFGLPANSLGDRDAMLDMGRNLLQRLDEIDASVDGYVGDVASCIGHVQKLGGYLDDDRVVGELAQRVSRRTHLASTLLAGSGFEAPLGRLRWKVALDEPCSLPIDGPERGALRRVLATVPDIRILELEEAAMCCGGAGAYAVQQPERSEVILQRKFDNVRRSGADILVTENISCLVQLRAGARRYAPGVRVMHLAEVLLAAIESGQRRVAAAQLGG